LESQARQDLLTGLANRRVLEERLKLALSQAARDERVVAVAFIDLDRFKPINDEMGHAAGDALLRELATRLTATVRDVDTVARVGGDEFVVMLSAPESVEAVEGVVRRIITRSAARSKSPDVRCRWAAASGSRCIRRTARIKPRC
jgi:diguanylate cyclase (GGDEF)-like protein